MQVNHTRIQHGVGQGSFHSASVIFEASNTKHRFDYIYDCGALANWQKTSELKHSVSRIWLEPREGSARPVLDMLILSHFDWDHMNGAQDLIARFEVDRIILPYLGPQELAIILASQAGSIADGTVEQLHRIATGGGTLWGSPITMVQRGPRRPRPEIPESPEDPSPSPEDFFRTSDEIAETPKRVTVVPDNQGAVLDRVLSDEEDLLAKAPLGSGFCNWKIRFWNRGMDKELGELILDTLGRVGFPVAALTDKVNGSRNIITWLNVRHRKGRPKKGSGGKKATTPSSNRDLAVAAYRSAIEQHKPSWLGETEGKNLSNFLSLGIYSGPNFQFDKTGFRYGYLYGDLPYPYPHIRLFSNDWGTLTGWIGTGDAPLGEPTVWDDFKFHYQNELPLTQTVLVPHHGAAPKKGPRFYNPGLNHKGGLNSVISYGTENTYGHPQPSVLSQIMYADGTLVLVNEKSKFGFHENYCFP